MVAASHMISNAVWTAHAPTTLSPTAMAKLLVSTNSPQAKLLCSAMCSVIASVTAEVTNMLRYR
eukprot:CAMPEP_0175609268 /NCGR_PEP_ID=MMETSP0096-20121207/62179_1 /TAXON_ID=311494 /ORGANISM="Alexandrium monilatum, Strain CCMP3105" /LENGTH=63 /DNA_ID=CAMNT_0016914195 /DNA_START=18 /DNA_END=206 /DNA_ORIENTATION=-